MLSSNRKTRSKGRLVRSLEFKPPTTTTPSKSIKPSTCNNKKQSSPIKSIWRKNVVDPIGFTTHKMSSVTNNFLSSDVHVSSSSSVEEMVGDLVDPGKGTLVFTQHDEIFRTSPLSSASSSFILEDQNDEDESIFVSEQVESVDNEHHHHHHHHQQQEHEQEHENSLGMTWNPKQNQWLPLIYRYVFPSSAFSIPKQSQIQQSQKSQNVSWSLSNGNVQFTTRSTSTTTPTTSSFTFPPPQKSIMMGSQCDDKDARDVCEKLLELMDDENLMLPAIKVPSQCSSPIETVKTNATAPPPFNSQVTTAVPLKSLLSEWSSLPSSPPPPIFHDVLCNRPIPELRLSPPMSGKSIGKRPIQNNPNSTNTTTVNSPCESPLTKRLRFSSSSSSIA